MIVNIIKSYRDIVTICDKELIGKKFENDKVQLEIKENFYNGKEVNDEEIIEIIKDMLMEDATFNIVGKDSVNLALKIGLINKEGIREVEGIPFALVLL